MKFCENCNNMLYISVEESNLKKYCKNCNFSEINNFSTSAECIMSTKFDARETDNHKQYMSKFIKYDPTLPRVDTIDCPSCETKPNKVIYIKYDHKNVKFLYCCCHCENFWR